MRPFGQHTKVSPCTHTPQMFNQLQFLEGKHTCWWAVQFMCASFCLFTSAAYKYGDGKKIDGKRVVVDIERGRTVKTWRPRKLGKSGELIV